ncbi:hypothetical protein [Bacillus cereus]|uniref:hypothetical protein n=1 Tax=Bacillus cereus TaxID=1396 RepID=UPI00269BA0BF
MSPKEILLDRSKNLKRALYQIDESMKNRFPDKNTADALENKIAYCQKLIDVVEKKKSYSIPKDKETINENIKYLQSPEDKIGKVGYKTAVSSFFVYETHIAISEERIMTATTVTTGDKL